MDWGRLIETGVTIAVMPLMAWNIKTLIEVRTTLFGANGSNGIRSRVQSLEDATANHTTRIAVLESKEAL